MNWNLDLLSVGFAVASTGILGFLVFFNNPKNITYRSFLLFSSATILWGITNYLNYQIPNQFVAFWLIRLTIFFAVWQAFYIFRLLYVFPNEEFIFPGFYKIFVFPLVILTAILTLSPYVFEGVAQVSPEGRIMSVTNGPAIAIFGLVSVGNVLAGIFFFIKKTLKASGIEKKQNLYVLTGIILTFALIILFNFIFPAFLNNPRFIPLGAVFLLPFIILTSYAIIRHGLLDIKIIAAEIMTFLLALATLSEIILSESIIETIFRSLVFVFIMIFGILLIRSVRREVEQRERLEILTKELQAANDRLKELDRLKSEFLSFASHQVKSPLTVIRGYASLILDGSYGPVSDKVRETIAKVKGSSEQMIALVNNLLDMRRIEEGKMQYNFENADLNKLVAETVDGLKPLADNKKLELRCKVLNEPAMVSVDIQKFHQVLQNFIDNAIKYTEHGWIEVSVVKQDSKYIVSVSDSGRGISKELLPNLFKQFSRDQAVQKAIQGTGLGLYIAKQIALAHKGDIWAESEGDGKGSKFLVSLPVLAGAM